LSRVASMRVFLQCAARRTIFTVGHRFEMTTLPSVSQVPWFALSYGLAGTVSVWCGIRRKSLRQSAFVSVGEVAISIALFNWFVQQERETDRLLGFEATV